MISNPQEVEQTAMAIANWIVYNKKPFTLPADNGSKVYLTILSEEQMRLIESIGPMGPHEVPPEAPPMEPQDVPEEDSE